MKLMDEVVALQVRNPYGKLRIYPMNSLARILVQLTGRKTFVEPDLMVIHNLGYVIEYVPQTMEGAE